MKENMVVLIKEPDKSAKIVHVIKKGKTLTVIDANNGEILPMTLQQLQDNKLSYLGKSAIVLTKPLQSNLGIPVTSISTGFNGYITATTKNNIAIVASLKGNDGIKRPMHDLYYNPKIYAMVQAKVLIKKGAIKERKDIDTVIVLRADQRSMTVSVTSLKRDGVYTINLSDIIRAKIKSPRLSKKENIQVSPGCLVLIRKTVKSRDVNIGEIYTVIDTYMISGKMKNQSKIELNSNTLGRRTVLLKHIKVIKQRNETKVQDNASVKREKGFANPISSGEVFTSNSDQTWQYYSNIRVTSMEDAYRADH